jgi:diguanylate cyclase (GGDEF)-like protein
MRESMGSSFELTNWFIRLVKLILARAPVNAAADDQPAGRRPEGTAAAIRDGGPGPTRGLIRGSPTVAPDSGSPRPFAPFLVLTALLLMRDSPFLSGFSHIDLLSLRAGIAAQYQAEDPESAQIRGAHLNSVSRLTPFAMAANAGSGALVLWAFRQGIPAGLWWWWASLMVVSGLATVNWWQRRHHCFNTASRRAMHHATLHAVALASMWSVMPLVWFAGASAAQQLLVATLVTGMLGAGTFALSPLPMASLLYATVIAIGMFGALWRAGDPLFAGVAALLGFYAPMVMIGSLFIWRKATTLLRSQAQAVRHERMLAVLLQDFEQHAGEALWETGGDGHLNHLSPRLAELLGAGPDDIRERSLLGLLEQRSPDRALALQFAMNAGRPFRDVHLILNNGNGVRHLSINGKPLMDDTARTLGWRGVVADVTDKIQGEDRLRELAHTDSLTGLANRVTLRDALADALAQGKTGALLMVDLDHFKAVNDSQGHSAGDELLKAVTRRLRDCVRQGDLVARLGGDEFAVLLTRSDDPDEAGALARRLVDSLAQPFEVQGRHVRVGASVGITLWRDTQAGVDELLVQSDTALYAAKESGRGRYEIYAQILGERSRRRMAIEDGLRHAIERGQLALHWQPKVEIGTGRLAGVEALMRWEHPQLGRVDPSEFISIAEQCGQIGNLGRWAIREACRAAAGHLGGLTASVNVSPLQLRDRNLVGVVRDAAREFHLEASQLELEITESVFIDDAHGALEQLHALRALGVRIALDDFGTGYSSLAYLRRFPFDTLKIDRAFINEVLLRKDARAIVQMIADLADTLSMRTVCEGVETEQQLAVVARAGCHEIQGYLVSVPRPLDDFVRWRRGWRASRPHLALRHHARRTGATVGGNDLREGETRPV